MYIKLWEREGMMMTRDKFELMENATKDEKSQAERWSDVQREAVKRVNSMHRTVCEANDTVKQNYVEVVRALWLLAAFAASWATIMALTTCMLNGIINMLLNACC